MQGDDIRNQRQDAEQNFIDAAGVEALTAHRNLALWVIAEQLFEIRSLLSIVTDSERKEINIFVNGGSVEARKGE